MMGKSSAGRVEDTLEDSTGHRVIVDLGATEAVVVPADGDAWSEATAAARSGDHLRALQHFRREAEARLAEGSHGRAAIAYRSAALQVRGDDGNDPQLQDHLWHRAADEYVEAAKQLPGAAALEALVAATMCYLQARNLEQAGACIEQANHRGRHALSPVSS